MIRIKNIIKALLASVISATVLIFVFSFILSLTADPLNYISVLPAFLFILAAFVGGCVSRRGGAGILNTVIYMTGYIGLHLILALVAGDAGGVMTPVCYLLALVAAVIGGGLFSSRGHKKPKGLKRYKKNKHR